jgi:hypothetical protein
VLFFLLSDPKFWLISVITTVIGTLIYLVINDTNLEAICPFFVMKFMVTQYFPWDYQKIQRYSQSRSVGEEAPLIREEEPFIKLSDMRV